MMSTIERWGRRLRLGVIGGGPGSRIGRVHRSAARLDDHYEVVASVLSSNPERSAAEGVKIGVAADRAYGTPSDMLAGETTRDDGIEVVAIMTPNDSHYALSCAAIESGLDIICDKPLATSLEDAVDLAVRVRKSGLVFCQTFNCTGFPLVRQAKAMIRDGDLGEVRMVQVEYVQGHNAALTDAETGDPSANWRLLPAKVGSSLVLSDIGSHAHHMACYVSGQAMGAVTADVGAIVPGRKAHDYAGVLFKLANGAPGVMLVTQAAAGAAHGLKFRIFGERGGLEWLQEAPNRLLHTRLGEPAVSFERNGPGLKAEARRAARLGIGHPEGYQEAFAVLYADAAAAIVARRLGETPDPLTLDFPTVEDGVATMKFIDAALQSARTGGWVDCG